jgi:hypothetical protein
MKKFAAAAAALVLSAAAAQALAVGDGVVVEYKDGARLSGVLADRTSASLTLDVGGAEITSKLSAIARVEPANSDVKTFEDMLQAAGDDPRALLEAANFARSRGLNTYYERVSALLDGAEADAGTDLDFAAGAAPQRAPAAPFVDAEPRNEPPSASEPAPSAAFAAGSAPQQEPAASLSDMDPAPATEPGVGFAVVEFLQPAEPAPSAAMPPDRPRRAEAAQSLLAREAAARAKPPSPGQPPRAPRPDDRRASGQERRFERTVSPAGRGAR